MVSDIGDALNMVKDKLVGWVEGLVLMLPNIVAAVLVLVLFLVAARVAQRVLQRVLARVSSRTPLNKLAGTFVGGAIVVVGVIVGLSILQLEKTVTSVLAGIGVVGLALGFAFQDIASNFMAGMLILMRRPLRVGHVVRTSDFFGVVEDITLRNTIVRTPSGESVLIPNKQVFQSPLVNYSRTNERRVDVEVGISYGDDLERAREVAVAAAQDVPHRDRERAVELFFTGFGSSSIDFVLRIWLNSPIQRRYMDARSEAIIAVSKAFDEHGITIPFPIRTLDFGIKGGATLAEVAPRFARARDGNGEGGEVGGEVGGDREVPPPA